MNPVIVSNPKFDLSFKIVLEHEGGYSDNPVDHGGATNYGVTQDTYNAYRVYKGLPLQPVKFITQDEVKETYHHFYWQPGKCEKLPSPVFVVHFDSCINHGVRRAALLLQKTAGVSPDGIIGPKTIKATLKDPLMFAKDYIKQRRNFYRNIVIQDSSQCIFLSGWLNRMNNLDKKITKL